MGDVINLRETPTMADIPGMLRQMAEDFEKGEIKAASVLMIVPTDEDWPDVYAWGEHMGDYAYIGLLELTKAFLVNNNTVRASGD